MTPSLYDTSSGRGVEGGGLFGRIAIEKGLVGEAQLARALRSQEEIESLGFKKPLGEILVEDGALRAEDVKTILRLQEINERVRNDRRFARIAVKNGFATQAQVDHALETVKDGGFRVPVGDLLVGAGVLSPTQERAIKLAMDRASPAPPRAVDGAPPAPPQAPLPSSSVPPAPPAAPLPVHGERATARLGASIELDLQDLIPLDPVETRITDVLFGAFALREGLVLVPELERCLREQSSTPIERPLPQVMVERGTLTPAEVQSIHRALDGARSEKISIPGYKLLSVLGRGVTSIVLRAKHELIGREVAIKLFRADHMEAADAELALAEARTIARIRHPNVVGLYDVGRVHRRLFYVMELIDGPTLGDIVRERGRLTEPEALGLAKEIAGALEAVRLAGLVHRDVKPQNILIADGGTAKLADLGLAREVNGAAVEDQNAIFGTPATISPEQAQGQPVDIRADLYGLGASLFIALTGSPPFEGKDAVSVMMNHLTSPVPDPRKKNPAISEEAAALVMQLLAKKREERPESPHEVVERIEKILASS